MDSYNRFSVKAFEAIVIVLLFIFLTAYSCAAQSWQRATQFGIETSVGINGFAVSPGGDRSKLRAMSRGISVGVIAGNNLLKGRMRLAGFYGPTKFSRCSGSLIESELLVNFYPLEFMRTRKNILDIYFTTGVKFANIGARKKPCPASGDAYLGSRTKVLSQVSGVGIVALIPSNKRFTNMFAEVLFSNPFFDSRPPTREATAWTGKSVCMNVGVRLGIRKSGE